MNKSTSMEFGGNFIFDCINLWKVGVKYAININIFAYRIFLGVACMQNIALKVGKKKNLFVVYHITQWCLKVELDGIWFISFPTDIQAIFEYDYVL